jgi:hypothetical protein
MPSAALSLSLSLTDEVGSNATAKSGALISAARKLDPFSPPTHGCFKSPQWAFVWILDATEGRRGGRLQPWFSNSE